MEPLGRENQTQNPQKADGQLERKNQAAELFCQTYLHCSSQQGQALWLYEPQALLWKAVRLSGQEGEAKIREAVLSVFPFKGTLPPPSRAFYDLLGQFPLVHLLTARNKMSISKFVEGQILFRSIAIHFHDFFRLYPNGNSQDLIAYFEKKQFFSAPGFTRDDQGPIKQLLEELFQSIRLEPSLDQLDNCFLHRIYTFRNALTAIQQPDSVFQAIMNVVGGEPSPAKKTEALANIPALGEIFFLNAARLHFHQLSQKEFPEDSFEKNLNSLCAQLAPFIRRAVMSVQENCIDHDKRCYDVLKNPDQSGKNSSSPLACTFLQALLSYFGYQADIYATRNINPALSSSLAHAFLVVTAPDSGQRFIVDPTYLQLFDGIIVDNDPQRKDLLIFRLEELDRVVDSFIQLKSNDTISVEELRLHFRTIWGLEGSYPVTNNYNANALFSDDPIEKNDGYQKGRELIKAIGLEEPLRRPTLKDRVRSLLKEAPKLSIPQLLERLSTINDNEKREFTRTLNLDPRPINANLLNVKTVGYFMSIREIVNPRHENNKIALYGCAGSDLSPLLALNVADLYMVERTVIDVAKLKETLAFDFKGLPPHLAKQMLDPYKNIKLMKGGQLAGNPDPQKDYLDITQDIELWIALELHTLGVDLKKVKVTKADNFNGVTLSFSWKYHGQKSKAYQITWIGAHLEEPNHYPIGLTQLLAKGIDFYYQKASNHIPTNYGKFLPEIGKAVKEGGYLLTSDYDMFGKKHPPENHLEDGRHSFPLIEETPTLLGYKKLFQGILPLGWFYPEKGETKERFIPPEEEYFVWMDIRKKTAKNL